MWSNPRKGYESEELPAFLDDRNLAKILPRRDLSFPPIDHMSPKIVQLSL